MTKPLFEQLQDSRVDGISAASVAERIAYAEALEKRLRASMAHGLPSAQFPIWRAAADAAKAAQTLLLSHPSLTRASHNAASPEKTK